MIRRSLSSAHRPMKKVAAGLTGYKSSLQRTATLTEFGAHVREVDEWCTHPHRWPANWAWRHSQYNVVRSPVARYSARSACQRSIARPVMIGVCCVRKCSSRLFLGRMVTKATRFNLDGCVFSDEKIFKMNPKASPQNDRSWVAEELRKCALDGDEFCSTADESSQERDCVLCVSTFARIFGSPVQAPQFWH